MNRKTTAARNQGARRVNRIASIAATNGAAEIERTPRTVAQPAHDEAARQRILGWLTKIMGEMKTVGEALDGYGRYSGALKEGEQHALANALEIACEELDRAMPRTVPAELAEDFWG